MKKFISIQELEEETQKGFVRAAALFKWKTGAETDDIIDFIQEIVTIYSNAVISRIKEEK